MSTGREVERREEASPANPSGDEISPGHCFRGEIDHSTSTDRSGRSCLQIRYLEDQPHLWPQLDALPWQTSRRAHDTRRSIRRNKLTCMSFFSREEIQEGKKRVPRESAGERQADRARQKSRQIDW